MIIGGTAALDLQGAELMQFVQLAKVGDLMDLQKIEQPGFHAAAGKNKEVVVVSSPKGNLFVPWTLIQNWVIDEIGKPGPQRIQTFVIETTAWREIKATLRVQLMIKDAVDAQIEKAICEAFSAYQITATGDIDSYVENQLKTMPGVSPYAFGVMFFYRVEVLSNRLVDDSRLRRVLSGLKEKYRISMIAESALNVLRLNQPHPNIEEKVDSAAAVETVAKENRPEPGCDGLVTDFKEFAKGVFLPESRTSWGWHRITFGCVNFNLYYPTTEFRDQELVASVYWTHPGPLDHYVKKMVEDCARESALTSVVVLIVFTDLTTAIASFKALFWQCLRDKLGQTLSCLDVGLVVNTVPKGDWH
jgi:hypothetical protein